MAGVVSQMKMKNPGDPSGFPGVFMLRGARIREVNRIDKRMGNSYNDKNTIVLILHREMRPA